MVKLFFFLNYNFLEIEFLYLIVSSVMRALSSKQIGPGFKSRPGKVGGLVTIIM